MLRGRLRIRWDFFLLVLLVLLLCAEEIFFIMLPGILIHELGHILLGHVGKYDLVSREPSSKDNSIERAANVFASRLLAPACVLWGCGVNSAREIAQLCNISQAAAEFRWMRMQTLYKRGKFLTSPMERQVYQQFGSYIESHRLRYHPQLPETGR